VIYVVSVCADSRLLPDYSTPGRRWLPFP
jgi:hypothetical protein